jgi:serine protease 12 (motopsin)/deleted-in-malignant-brain-tumors protein 1
VVDGDIPAVDEAGRMEVCLGGSWGSICNDGWTDTSADYICKNLNMNYTGSK